MTRAPRSESGAHRTTSVAWAFPQNPSREPSRDTSPLMLWNRDSAMTDRWPDLGNTITSLSAAARDITFLSGRGCGAAYAAVRLSLPEVAELRRHQLFVSDRLRGESARQGKLVQALDCLG